MSDDIKGLEQQADAREGRKQVDDDEREARDVERRRHLVNEQRQRANDGNADEQRLRFLAEILCQKITASPCCWLGSSRRRTLPNTYIDRPVVVLHGGSFYTFRHGPRCPEPQRFACNPSTPRRFLGRKTNADAARNPRR